MLPDAAGGERMPEGGAVQSQDGAGRGSDGERLAASPHEEPKDEHQLELPRQWRAPTLTTKKEDFLFYFLL